MSHQCLKIVGGTIASAVVGTAANYGALQVESESAKAATGKKIFLVISAIFSMLFTAFTLAVFNPSNVQRFVTLVGISSLAGALPAVYTIVLLAKAIIKAGDHLFGKR